MKHIYANLLGDWVCLNDDPNCTIGKSNVSPNQWYEENATIFAPIQRENENTYYQLDYVNIFYKNKTYRINPIFIQIVSE